MSVSVLTPTKGRPEALELIQRWIGEQTVDVQHVIVEGLELPAAYAKGLEACEGEWIVLTDDDDWYGPTYVERVIDTMRSSQATIGGHAYREVYHIRGRAFADRTLVGPLPGTLAFHRMHIPDAIAAVQAGKSIKYLGRNQAPCFAAPFLRVVGLYQDGISTKHRYTSERFPTRDPEMAYLRRRIGDAALDAYVDALERIRTREAEVASET